MKNRRALVVGINTYRAPGNNLRAAVADATAMAERLRKNADSSPNFDCRALLDRMDDGSPITRASLRGSIQELFTSIDGDALLYFSGHGVLSDVEGYLATYDAEQNDFG